MAAENLNYAIKFLIVLLNSVVAIAGLNIYLAAIYDGYHRLRPRHLQSILDGRKFRRLRQKSLVLFPSPHVSYMSLLHVSKLLIIQGHHHHQVNFCV